MKHKENEIPTISGELQLEERRKGKSDGKSTSTEYTEICHMEKIPL